jgi:carbonic anhydrase
MEPLNFISSVESPRTWPIVIAYIMLISSPPRTITTYRSHTIFNNHTTIKVFLAKQNLIMSFSASAESYHLHDGHILKAVVRNVDGEPCESEIDLDQFIGNQDGWFMWDGAGTL